jgi:hypothetical protein
LIGIEGKSLLAKLYTQKTYIIQRERLKQPIATYRQKYLSVVSVLLPLNDRNHPKEPAMNKMSPAVMFAALLFFGATVYAEETASAPASQSTDLTSGNQNSKRQAPGKKHLSNHKKVKKTKTPANSRTPQK